MSSAKPSRTNPPRSFAFFTDRALGKIVPSALVDAGYRVERHDDHFEPSALDQEIFRAVGRHRDWIMLTKDKRQRYRPDEMNAVMRSGVSLFIHAGNLAHPELAASFCLQAERMIRFREKHGFPFIAKVYGPIVTEYRTKPGEIRMSLDMDNWRDDSRS